MSAAIDTEQCARCGVVNWCDRWVPGGEWKHRKGVEPCRPVPESKPKARPLITEVPIPSPRAKSCKGCKPAGPVTDAEQVQRDRFRLRDQK